MSRYCLALAVVLSCSFAAPAWAQGYGCGGYYVSQGCYGGWTSTGCCGGMPVSYGCYGSGWYSMGCYGSSPVYSSGCCGGMRVYSSGCCGGTPIVYGSSWYAAPVIRSVPVTSGTVRVVKESAKIVHQERRQEPAKESVKESVKEPAKAPAKEPAREHLEASNKAQVENLGPPEGEVKAPTPATIVVKLPPHARLAVNDKASQLTATTRKFISPPLQPGKDYSYVLKAEYTRDGQEISATERVVVRAGEEKHVLLGSAAGRSTP